MAPRCGLLALAAAAAAAPRAAGLLRGSSTVSNVLPRVDAATGAILDLHDGNTLRVGDTFWWFGASYGVMTPTKIDLESRRA